MSRVWRNHNISPDGNKQFESRFSLVNDNDADSRNKERLEKQADLSNVKTFNQHKEHKAQKEQKEHKQQNKRQDKQRWRIF
jgi:hypothetical protein